MAGLAASLADIDAYENQLFDEYNGEGRKCQEDFYDDLEYGDWDSAEEGDRYYDPTLKKRGSYADRCPAIVW